MEVVEGRLRVDEAQLHQPPGGIVHLDQQRARRPAFFKPSMFGTVDLDQLTEAVTTVAGLVDRLVALLAAFSEAGFHEPQPQRLTGQDEFMLLR